MRGWIVLCVLSLLLGCARTKPFEPVADTLMPPPMTVVPEPSVSEPTPAEIDWLLASEPVPQVTPQQAVQAIQWATQHSLVRPSKDDFARAGVRWRYRPGVIWHIDTAMNQPTHLSFDVGSGWMAWEGLDKQWWNIQVKRTGEPPHVQGDILLMPKDAGLSGRLTVLTDCCVYYLSLRSTKSVGLTAVSWLHPPPPDSSKNGVQPITTFHTGYARLVQGAAPLFTPVGVWDTGLDGRTLILLPEAVQVHEMPILTILSASGERQILNFQRRGDWLIAHRLFEMAELRLGHDEKTAEIVRIERSENYREITCPGDAACPPGGWQ